MNFFTLLCPRCGDNVLHEDPMMNKISHMAHVYICMKCGLEEAFNTKRAWYQHPEVAEDQQRIWRERG